MSTVNRTQALGATLGLAAFVLIVLALVTGARPGRDLKPGPIEPGTIAPAEQLSRAFAMVAAHVRPGVVSVYSEKTVKFSAPEFGSPFGDDFFRQFFGDEGAGPQRPPARPREFRGQQRGMGSGMVLDKQGHVLTNYHVVHDTDALKVQLADKRQFEAELVGADPKSDVAVIKIKGEVPKDLPTITLGDSDALQVGDLVMAIGAPFGLAQTVTEGIISATGRSDVGIADYEDFLQTDTPINPGNSGGPLVNMRGEVIGMNTAIATNVGQFAGVGFAIPSVMIKTILPKLVKGERITRGQLGVVIQDITKDLAKAFRIDETKGVLVAQVNKGSPAEAAGLKAGDVIVQYDRKDVEDVRSLRNLVAATAPGAKVAIGIVRDGKTLTLTAAVGRQTELTTSGVTPAAADATTLAKLGLEVQTLTPDLARQLGADVEKGLAVTAVAAGSVAATAGLQQGDVIVETDRQPVASVEELEGILAKKQGPVLFLIRRHGTQLFVVLEAK